MTLLTVVSRVAQAQSSLFGSISVDDKKVSAQTNFNFDLTSSSATVASNDYLLIELPEELESRFSGGSNSPCSVDNASVSQCIAVSDKIFKIVFGRRMSTTSIKGSVSKFSNPPSIRPQTNIQITLYDSNNEARLITYIGDLTSFEPGGLEISLSSSSNIIGDNNAVLNLGVVPETFLVAAGTIVVNFPQYYKDAGSDQMISVTTPSCSADGVTINECLFNSASRSLTITYEMNSGSAFAGLKTFQIRNFKNPVNSEEKRGFSAITTDEFSYTVGESGEVSLPAVTEPTQFKNVQFLFDDTNSVGLYSTFRITIAM